MTVKGIPNKIFGQVCIIVRDVDASAQRYADILGLDFSENFQTTHLHDHTKATYYGQPTDAIAKLTSTIVGQLQFELLQPLDEGSEWMDYLKRHGEGIHHVAFFVPDTAKTAQSFVDHGYVITQQGLFTGQTGMYTYLDTHKDLGIVIELLEFFGDMPAFEQSRFDTSTGLGTDVITQVGVIVNDIEATSQRIADVLGVPKPPVQQTAGYDVTETTFNGEPSEATAKLAFFPFGQVTLELIQPDEKPSVWRNYLNEKGEGAQHIAFGVDDTERATDHLARHGIGISQQGLYSDRSGIYTYVASDEALGTTLELLESFPQPR